MRERQCRRARDREPGPEPDRRRRHDRVVQQPGGLGRLRDGPADNRRDRGRQ